MRPGGGGSCFATIQEASDIANPGDRVNISRGTYFENVTVDVEGLTLRGAGDSSTIIDADNPNSGTGIFIDAANVKVERLSVHNGQSDGIYFIAMELLSGETLKDLIKREKAVSAGRVGPHVGTCRGDVRRLRLGRDHRDPR